MPATSDQRPFFFKSFGVSKTEMAYAALSGGPAGVAPFAALWLRAHGAPVAAVGSLIALPLIARIVLAGPLGFWASRFSMPWKPMSLLCIIAAIASVWAVSGSGLWSHVVAWWTICFSIGACTPLMDAATLDSTLVEGEGEVLLARTRKVSAIAYMGANLAVGFVFAHFGVAGPAIWVGLTALIAAVSLPNLMINKKAFNRKISEVIASAHNKRAIKANTTLCLVLLASAFIEASHGFNAIAMISWAQRGYDPSLCGILWATGILTDIFFLSFMYSFRARLGPSRMLILGGVAAVIRWAGFAAAPTLPIIFILQILHALSFTATYLASVALVHKLSDHQRRLPAQAMNWAFSTGLATGLSILCAGPLYAALNTQGYWVMSGVAAIGLVLAIASNRNNSLASATVREANGIPSDVVDAVHG